MSAPLWATAWCLWCEKDTRQLVCDNGADFIPADILNVTGPRVIEPARTCRECGKTLVVMHRGAA